MQIANREVLARYGLALLLVVLVTLLRLPLNFLIGVTAVPFILYFPAVMLSGWYGRFGPGLLATLSSVLAALYFNIEPRFTIYIPNRQVAFQIALFIVTGLLISVLNESWHRTNERLSLSQETEQQQREWLQVTLKSVGDAVIATDANGAVNFMNAVAESLTGWRQEEAMGKPLDKVFHIINEQNRAEVESPVAKVLRLGNIVGLANHTLLISRDGKEIPIDDSGAPIKDAAGKTMGVVLVFHDISERSQAEQQQHFLFEIAEIIRRADNADELLFTVARAVGEHLSVRRCLFNEIDLEHDREIVHRDYCRGVESVAGVHKISEYSSITSADMEHGSTVVNRDSRTDPRTADLYEQTYEPNGERAYIAVPLLRNNRWVASLWVSDDKPRQWGAQQINLLEAIAERAWLAVEKLRNEKALRESEERLRLATEAVSIYSWEIDLRDRSFHWSENAERVANIPKPKSIAAAMSLIHADDHANAERAFEQAIQNRSEFAVEYRVANRPHDDEMWGFTAGVVIPAADGTPTRLVGITQDISERKRAEKGLAHLAAIVSSSSDAIVSKTLDGIITSWNSSAEKLFGYTVAEMIGQPIVRIIPPDRHLEEEELLARLRAGEPIEHYETVRVTKDGRLLDVSLTISPIKDNAGRIIGASKIIRDISERKRGEERLRESEQRLAATYEYAPIGIIECSSAGTYINVNEEFCHIVGYTKEELLAHGIKDLTHPDDYPQDIRLHQQLVASEIPFYQIEKRFLRKDGAIVWAQLRRSIVRDAEGEPLYTIGAVQDITEKKRIEQERERLLQSEKQARRQAEDANRLKDEFLATVSHELRTPLNAILGWSRILRGGASDATILERAIETIERNARAQAEIIEDLLDVSRIITGNLRLDTQLVELPVVIQEALESVRPAAEAKEIHLQTRFTPNLLPISGDHSRLRQIVWNLLSNAVKFTPRGGKVDVQAERQNGQIEIKVSDTGSGISADFLPFVFDRFRQQDSSSTRKYGGLGLGLAIVRQLVELHGGTVEAQSNGQGQGATFFVRLPLIANLEVARHNAAPLSLSANLNSPASASVPRLDGLRVLVVDDEADTLDLVHTLLERSGAAVTGARSAAAALATLQAMKPDVLIADIEMPEEDGYSLIKKIRALPGNGLHQLPAIALTAYARTEDRLRALAAGFDAHIAKPMEPLELLTVIANLARRIGKGSA